MPRTRADLLRFSIAFGLMKAKVHGRKGLLTEAQRYEVAEYAIAHLRKYGDWELDKEVIAPIGVDHDWKRLMPDKDPIPKDDPIALLEWGKRNILKE